MSLPSPKPSTKSNKIPQFYKVDIGIHQLVPILINCVSVWLFVYSKRAFSIILNPLSVLISSHFHTILHKRNTIGSECRISKYNRIRINDYLQKKIDRYVMLYLKFWPCNWKSLWKRKPISYNIPTENVFFSVWTENFPVKASHACAAPYLLRFKLKLRTCECDGEMESVCEGDVLECPNSTTIRSAGDDKRTTLAWVRRWWRVSRMWKLGLCLCFDFFF